MTIHLYMWVIVAMGGFHPETPISQWQYMGDYVTPAACATAASNLKTTRMDPSTEYFRCIDKATGELKR